MRSYRNQFCECFEDGYTDENVFVPFTALNLPLLPSKDFLDSLEEGDGLYSIVCGRFGGVCSSKNEKCVELRKGL
jgi:hypothetical protein